MAAVGFSISGIPGPPLGPSYRITTTSPLFTFPSRMPSLAANSDHQRQLAEPLKTNPSFPVILATEPSGANISI